MLRTKFNCFSTLTCCKNNCLFRFTEATELTIDDTIQLATQQLNKFRDSFMLLDRTEQRS